ncbi:MAG: GntR family transcriptional regulator [Oscillospiraceae bacterium]
MDIIISNADPRPIYEQVTAQIKNAIVSGELSEGDALPSIRSLAKDLRISVITTKRAYDELEKEGFINTVAGKGCFVAQKNLEFIREQNLRQIEDSIRKIIELGKPIGISKEEVFEMYDLISKE